VVVAAWADSGPRVAVVSAVSIATSLLAIIVAMEDAVGVEGSWFRTWDRDEVILVVTELALVAAGLSLDVFRFLRDLSEMLDRFSASWERSLSATERVPCELGAMSLAFSELTSAWRDAIVLFSLVNSANRKSFLAFSKAIS
jgi:hypothetical protein